MLNPSTDTKRQGGMTKRIEFIDVAKGFGILLVVLGHNPIKYTQPALIDFIFSFHMPLFFLLSGMFFRTDIDFLTLARRRFHTLLQPYLVTILMIYFVITFFSDVQLSLIVRHLAKSAYASGNYLDWAQLWFLPALFVLNLYAFVYYHVLYKRLGPLWARVLVLAATLWLGVLTLRSFWDTKVSLAGYSFTINGLPFSLDLLLVIGTFFFIGYEMRQQLPESFYASWWTLLISGVMLVGLNLFFQFRIDLFSRTYGSFGINTLEALSGSVFVLSVSKQISERGGWLSLALQYFGLVSLVLLIFHAPIQTFSFYKLDDWIPNPYIVGILSFVLAVGIPLFIYERLIRPNRVVATWFGMEALSARKEQSNTMPQETKLDE